MATKKKSKAKPKSKSTTKSKSKPKVKAKIKVKAKKAAKPKARTSVQARGRASARASAPSGKRSAAREAARVDAEFPSKPRKTVDTDTESSGDRRSSLGRGRATRSAQVEEETFGKRNPLKDDYYEPRGSGSESGGQSGDDEGLSVEESADSESVEELTEEGQDYEAEIVAGVERAGTNLEQEVPVDDRADGGAPFGKEPEEPPRKRRGRGTA